MMWFAKEIMEKRKKGIFLPHVTKCVGLFIRSNVLENLQGYFKINYSLKHGQERMCDLEGHINQINWPVTHEVLLDEYLLKNYVMYHEIVQRKKKWNILIQLEEGKRKKDPDFPRFFVEESDVLKRIDLYINNFEKLYGKSVGHGSSPQKDKFPIKKP